MRAFWMAAALAAAASAQETTFHSKVPLVIVPAAITDSAGRPVAGVGARDLALYDNSVAQPIHVDDVPGPVSLALVVQTSWPAAVAMMRRNAGLIEPLITGEGGEAALVTYHAQARVAQPFTADVGAVAAALRKLEPRGEGNSSVDAVLLALDLLRARPAARRRVILLLGEARDRGSSAPVARVLERLHGDNVSVYSVAFSRFLTAFTSREPLPGDGRMNLFGALADLKRLAAGSAAEGFAAATGGRVIPARRAKGLDEAVRAIGEELHGQYLLSFTPPPAARPGYHALRVEVRGRPDLQVRARPGYLLTP